MTCCIGGMIWNSVQKIIFVNFDVLKIWFIMLWGISKLLLKQLSKCLKKGTYRLGISYARDACIQQRASGKSRC